MLTKLVNPRELAHLATIFAVAFGGQLATLGTSSIGLKALVAGMAAGAKVVFEAVVALEEGKAAK